MNLPSVHTSDLRRHQAGSAVIVVMALLTLILVYVAMNLRTINSLGRELKLLERQQSHRLRTATHRRTNPPAIPVTTH